MPLVTQMLCVPWAVLSSLRTHSETHSRTAWEHILEHILVTQIMCVSSILETWYRCHCQKRQCRRPPMTQRVCVSCAALPKTRCLAQKQKFLQVSALVYWLHKVTIKRFCLLEREFVAWHHFHEASGRRSGQNVVPGYTFSKVRALVYLQHKEP